MDDTIQNVHNYLINKGYANKVYLYKSAMLTESNFPETAKILKKYAFTTYNYAIKYNDEARTKIIPYYSNIIDSSIIESFVMYFKEEKECLNILKELLKNHKQLIKIYPKNSCCSLLAFALCISCMENINKINNIFSFYKIPGTVILQPEMIEPQNRKLVKQINSFLNNAKD